MSDHKDQAITVAAFDDGSVVVTRPRAWRMSIGTMHGIALAAFFEINDVPFDKTLEETKRDYDVANKATTPIGDIIIHQYQITKK